MKSPFENEEEIKKGVDEIHEKFSGQIQQITMFAILKIAEATKDDISMELLKTVEGVVATSFGFGYRNGKNEGKKK